MTDSGIGGGTAIQATGGGSVRIGVTQAEVVEINNTGVVSGGDLSVRGASFISINDGLLTSSGPMTLATNNLTLSASSSGTLLTSSAPGDAILLRGPNVGTSMVTFAHPNSGNALNAPNGRWLVAATDINDGSFSPGSLVYDFKRYGAASDAPALQNDVGNGLVFANTETATLGFSSGQFQAKTYDGTLAVGPLGGSIVSTFNSVLGDSYFPDVGITYLYANKDAGTNKPVNLATPDLAFIDQLGKPVYGYSVTSNLTANILPKSLGGTVSVANRVYDATPAVTATVGAVSGFVGSETVTVSASGAMQDKNVGVAKPTSLSYAIQDGANGGLAGNYSFAPSGVTLPTITAAPLALTGLAATSKVYDTTTAATLAGTPAVTPLGSDSVGLLGSPTGTFNNKNVGTGKPVTVSGLGLTGADSLNYTLIAPVGMIADITPAPLLVTGLAAANKVYDATVTATLSGSASVTPLGNDIVSVAGTPVGAFADKNVGTGKIVSLGALSLTGTDAGNYTPVAPVALTADITRASVTVTGVTAASKVYDATTVATLAGNPTVAAFAGDAVSVGGPVQAFFADKNVGSGKSVAVGGYSLSGADAGNYQLVQPSGLSAAITPATLQISGLTAASKTYDGTVVATVSGSGAVAALGDDVVTVSGTPVANFSSKDVGTGKSVLISGISLGGADAGNYFIGSGALVATANITPATLTYVATPVSQAAGLELPPLTGSVRGFVAGETLQSATTGTLGFTTTATVASVAGQYPILGSGLTAANYLFVQDPANATALTLNVSQPELIVAKKSADAAPQQALQLMAQPTAPADPGLGGVVDLVAPPAKSPTAAATSTATASATTSASTSSTPSAAALAAPSAFEPVTLSALSAEDVAVMLDARVQYKKELFADAVAALEKNAALADMPPCRTRVEALAGGCLMTAALKRELQDKPTRPATASPGAATAPSAPAAQTQAQTQTPTAPASAAPAAPAAQATVFDPSAPPLLAGNARRVINASLPQIERKVALVIGVDRYDDPSIPALANAVGDARAIGKVLESQLGYETVVLDNATKKSVVAALNRLATELGPKDSVIIYYAGHGELVEATKLGYWQLSDSDPKRPETWLSNADIGKMVAQVEASQVALISDSCYSGSLVTDQRIRAASAAIDPAQVLSRKSVVVMSSGGNEPVADAGKQGHSPFAYSLINNFRQLSAWQPGGNVFERVRFAVARELPQRPQYGAFSAAGHQAGDYLFEQRQLEPGSQ